MANHNRGHNHVIASFLFIRTKLLMSNYINLKLLIEVVIFLCLFLILFGTFPFFSTIENSE